MAGSATDDEKWDPRSDPDWQSDEEVAYHEAGHALVAYALGGRILSMTIEEIEYPEGIERGLTRHYIAGLDREIQCRMAGGKATLIQFGNRHGATHDLKACLRSLRDAGHGDWSHEQASAYLERMDRVAGQILMERWRRSGLWLERRSPSGPWLAAKWSPSSRLPSLLLVARRNSGWHSRSRSNVEWLASRERATGEPSPNDARAEPLCRH
jgi:hypothetical protein